MFEYVLLPSKNATEYTLKKLGWQISISPWAKLKYNGVTKSAVRTNVAGIRSHVAPLVLVDTQGLSFQYIYVGVLAITIIKIQTMGAAKSKTTTTIIIFQN